jgi:hypothetical protein
MSSFISFDNRSAIEKDARSIARTINTLHNAVARHAKTDSAFMQSEYQKQIDACNKQIPAAIANWKETYNDQAGGSNWFNYTSGLHSDLVSEYLASQKVGA